MAFPPFNRSRVAVASSRLTKLRAQIFAVIIHTSRTIATGIFLIGMSLAQQTSKEPAQPTLHVQTDLVVVPFQVQRGSRQGSNLKPSDVVLLEDGVPRAFTVFDAPQKHPSLQLELMFDVTDEERGGFWSAKALHDMVDYWNEMTAEALLEEPGAVIQISVYQFDQFRLRRLCRSINDPKDLLDSIDRLTDLIPIGQGFDLPLLEGAVIRDDDPWAATVRPWSRSLSGAIAVLRDSAAGSTTARALVIFSTGAEGTSITPQDLADQAGAADVPIYPVVLPSLSPIWYDGYAFDPEEAMRVTNPLNAVLPRSPQLGICRDASQPGGTQSVIDCPLNKPFENVGNQTGGRSFEAARRGGAPKLPSLHEGLQRFSMTGGQLTDIIQAVKKSALARFSSIYTVGFTPSSSNSPRKHKLEVKLASKSSGKVTDGKKIAIY